MQKNLLHRLFNALFAEKNILGKEKGPDNYVRALLLNLQYTGGRGRTDTPVKERDFESRASANSATPASNDLADKNYYSTSYFIRQYFINITEKFLINSVYHFTAGKAKKKIELSCQYC